MPRERAKVFREVTEEERKQYWYVELPAERETVGRRVSEDRWKQIVHGMVSRRPDGRLVVCMLDGEIAVGSEEWRSYLTAHILAKKYRMFWEHLAPPKPARREVFEDGVAYTLWGNVYKGTPAGKELLSEVREAYRRRSRRKTRRGRAEEKRNG